MIKNCIENPVKLSCNSEIAEQIRNYILPKSNQNKKIPIGKLYIGAILKVFF